MFISVVEQEIEKDPIDKIRLKHGKFLITNSYLVYTPESFYKVDVIRTLTSKKNERLREMRRELEDIYSLMFYRPDRTKEKELLEKRSMLLIDMEQNKDVLYTNDCEIIIKNMKESNVPELKLNHKISTTIMEYRIEGISLNPTLIHEKTTKEELSEIIETQISKMENLNEVFLF